MSGKRTPAASDNLKLIDGIGPKVERRLREANILTFAQLAAMSATELADLLEGMIGINAERISELDWIGEARRRAAESNSVDSRSDRPSSGNHQHYATFTIKLLLDDDHTVRRTQVRHIQSSDKKPEMWAGWDVDRMVEFIVQRAELRLLSPKPSGEVATPAKSEPPSVTPSSLGPRLRLRELGAVLPDANGIHCILCHDQPFNVRLCLDLSEQTAPGEDLVNCAASVYAKDLRGGPSRILGEARGTITQQEQLSLTIKGRSLPRGLYRINAQATLSLPSANSELETLLLEGSPLQIY